MSPERWQRIGDVFLAARHHDPSKRKAYLDQTCGDDRELAVEVGLLVANYERAKNEKFLEESARLNVQLLETTGEHYGSDRVDRGHFAPDITLLQCQNCGESFKDISADVQDASCSACGSTPQLDSVKTLGRYELLKWIGAGRFGDVYRAEDPELKRIVAVKVLKSKMFSTREHKQSFEREAQRAAKLRHAGMVRVYDIGEEGDEQYIVTEFIEGEDLGKRLQRGRLPQTDAALLVAAAAEALHDAHLAGLIHRDVKPGNILLDQHGQPHVTDFGLAVSYDDVGEEWRTFAGTPPYMSSEQVRDEGHRITPRTDIYSLGVVLYELLCGELPFASKSVARLFDQILYTEIRPPRTIDDRIASSLERICLKAMSKRISDRYTTAKDLAGELRLVVATLRNESSSGESNSPDHDADKHFSRVVPKGLRAFGPEDADFFLQLLPGPRDRDGLPDSIRFWKTRIESSDDGTAFAIGLMYGPSGCGKSSLVRAGLLPQLDNSVLPVYVEATGGDTERRLASRLRNVFPTLDAGLSLVELMSRLRRGQDLASGEKVLIVLDQIEQWLHVYGQAAESTELVAALRQLDGEHTQCLILVRDDFWSATDRLFRNLEIPMEPNVRLVDLFDEQHARHVLKLFGSAYGQLPTDAAEQAKFFDQAVKGLGQDGMVIPVRLSLFADLMKNRPWTSESLVEVGGTEGVGVKFLEETFSARRAVPEYRAIAAPARAILRALSPEHGSTIKGLKSRFELATACGLTDDSSRFNRIIEVLDRQLHIITPTEPEPVAEGDTSRADSNNALYRLTHDYLVPSLREWLTRNQKETRRGRAELRLVERSTLWNARPENRYLPSSWEFLNIGFFTRNRDRTTAQRKMMKKAGRYHAVRWSAALVLLAVFGMISAGVRIQQNADRANNLVKSLLAAEIKQVPNIVNQINSVRRWADPRLRAVLTDSSTDQNQRVKVRLALLPVDHDQVDKLVAHLLKSEDPKNLLVIRDALAGFGERIAPELWRLLEDDKGDENRRIRAACALAAFDPLSNREGWLRASSAIVDKLMTDTVYLGQWRDALEPVRDHLLTPLAQAFRGADKAKRSVAANVLAVYAADRVELLAALVTDADAQQYGVLWPVLERHSQRAAALMEQELERSPSPVWNDSPPNPSWSKPDGELVKSIEEADGMLTDRFALCQTMPMADFAVAAVGLRPSGYRPIRFRPYVANSEVWVAAVWTRDHRDWQLCAQGVSAEEILAQDETWRAKGYWPTDVAGFLAPAAQAVEAERYVAVWSKDEADHSKSKMYVGIHIDERRRASKKDMSDGYVPQTVHVMRGADGYDRYSSVCEKADYRGYVHINTGGYLYADGMCPGRFQLDVSLRTVANPTKRLLGFLINLGLRNGDKRPLYSAVWHRGGLAKSFESQRLHALTPAEQLQQGRTLVDEGYRPAALAVAWVGGNNPLMTASVWHRPIFTDEHENGLAKRKANAAISLLHLDQVGKVWPLLEQAKDPRLRTYLIHQLKALGVQPQALIRRLEKESNVTAKRALIVCLGQFIQEELPEEDRQSVLKKLLVLYRNDPDAGVHSAIDWALRRWGQSKRIEPIDREMASQQSVNGRNWYANKHGHTLAVVNGPVEFQMGSAVHEPNREGGEFLHTRRIPHSFAIATKEVTVRQFEEFAADFRAHVFGTRSKEFSPAPDGPMLLIGWHEAVAYCQWLSEKEGVPPDQWCYPPVMQIVTSIKLREPIKFPADYSMRTGYRLPTEVEWEYACRAGSMTSRFFGSDEEMLGEYVWNKNHGNGVDQAWTVGSLKPNDLGMFDMLGNAWEWCHALSERIKIYGVPAPDGSMESSFVSIEDTTSPLASEIVVTRESICFLRGGAFDSRPSLLRSASLWRDRAMDRSHMSGLRVCRTLTLEREQTEPSQDRYDLPNSDVEGLLRFIEELEQFAPPRTTDQDIEYDVRGIPAIVAAAKRIVMVERDKSSEAYQVASRVLLHHNARYYRNRADNAYNYTMRDQGKLDAAVQYYDKAIELYSRLVDELGRKELVGELAKTLNRQAWLYATYADGEYRNGSKAVELAAHAARLTNWRVPEVLDTLAAAYAEAGDFTEAIKWQNKAIEIAPNHKKPDLRTRLELYQAGKPFRQPQ